MRRSLHVAPLFLLSALLLRPDGVIEGQELWRSPVEAGVLRLQFLGGFEAADRRAGAPAADGERGGLEPLGSDLTLAPLDARFVPWLDDVDEGLREALGDPGLTLPMGETRGYLKSHSTRIPVQLAFGAADRLTIGAGGSLVRRRVDGALAYLPDAAQGGLLAEGAGSSFLGGLRAAIEDAEVRLLEICSAQGGSSSACQSAEATVATGQAALQGLGRALSGPVFPVAGTEVGMRLQVRMESLADGLAEMGVGRSVPPLPFAPGPLSNPDFRNLFLGPVGEVEDLFQNGVDEVWALGDPSVFALVTLVDRGGGPPGSAPDLRIVLEAGGRLGVEDPAPLRHLLSLDPERGYHRAYLASGAELRMGSRWGLRGDAGWERFFAREELRAGYAGVLEADRPFWFVSASPGDRIRMAVAPTVFLTEELQVGGSYHFTRVGDERLSLGEGGPDPTGLPSVLPGGGGGTLHRLGVFLSYSAVGPFRRDAGGLPVELLVRAQSVRWGEGQGLLADTRVEAGIRLHRTLFGRE